MDISDEELRKYSPSQLLEYTLKLRQDVRKNGHVYSYPYSKSWFDLPFEMREIVIDEMDVKTRCKFARCSKLCETEAKRSKNYLHSIDVSFFDNVLSFSFDDRKRHSDFTLKFDEFDELKTTVICRPSDSRKKNMGWKTIEEGKPNDVLKKYLNNYLEIYRKSIKRFSLRDVADLESVKGVSIKNLRYLKEVYVDFSFDSLESLIECGFTDYKQILRIETVTFISLDKLELETILKFQGKYLTVDVADFVVRMNEFLIKCKNGEIHDNVEMFDFYYPTGLDNFSSLDHERIIQGLDIFKSEMNHFKHELSFRFASSAKKSGMINVLYYSSKIKVEFKKE